MEETPDILYNWQCVGCLAGPALVFEGEESMLAAISANPMSFKVWKLMRFGSLNSIHVKMLIITYIRPGNLIFTVLFALDLAAISMLGITLIVVIEMNKQIVPALIYKDITG